MSPAAAKLKAWREDPVLFVKEVFHAEPDLWQIDVLNEFKKSNRIAMKASKGVGKSTILAWCAWNFLVTRPNAKMVATSISAENLADGLWSELALWQNKSKLLQTEFVWTKTRIFLKSAPETHFLSARTWAKGADPSQQANTLAGIHADYVLFILDEVGSIPDGVLAAAEAGLSTGKETKIIMAGNPTELSGPLYRACTSERHLWYVKEINSDPNDPQRSPRVSIQWAKEQIEKYGADNPYVLVNVFGKFPPSSLNVLLGPDEVEAAMSRQLHEPDYQFAQKRLGVDIARFGLDRTCLFPRQGLRAFRPVVMRNANTMEIAARVAEAKNKWGCELEAIDGTGGFGSGVVDALRNAGHAPMEIHFAGKASDARYANIRAEMYFRMAEWVKRGGVLPNLPELKKELTTPTYTFTNQGKLILESKDQIKERLGESTDLSDALALTFALPELPTQVGELGRVMSSFTHSQQLKTDWDPLELDSHS